MRLYGKETCGLGHAAKVRHEWHPMDVSNCGSAKSDHRRCLPARVSFVLLCIATFFLTGCASMAPPTIVRDRFDYVTSISESWKRQMLLNLLKTRYVDAPVFMDISSVINSYSVEGNIDLGGEIAPVGRGDTFAGVGVTGRYADKPTISYVPLAGDKFARSLMNPLPITGVLLLIQSGLPSDVVLRICVHTINGIENSYGGMGNPRPGNPKFHELMKAFRETQAAGGSVMRIIQDKGTQTIVVVLHPSTDQAVTAPVAKIRELLGLDASVRKYNVVYGSFPENDREIAMLTRSVMQILADFASYIDVPETDLEEGRVYEPQRTAEQLLLFPPILRVHTGPSAPDDAYAAVRYRNHWFWIDDRDTQTKSMFNSVLLLFSLTETARPQSLPLVTIPTQ
jgi:hypothetical protein